MRVALTRRRARASTTLRFCSSSSCSHRYVSGMGMSMKLRFSCGMTLLGWLRYYRQIGNTAQKRIDQAEETEQVFPRADEGRILGRVGGGVEVRPFRRD